jgi:hypothetical protein
MSIQRRLDADSCRRIAQMLAEPDVNSEDPKTLEAHCPDGKMVFTGGARVAWAAPFPATAAASLTWLSPTPRAHAPCCFTMGTIPIVLPVAGVPGSFQTCGSSMFLSMSRGCHGGVAVEP